MGLKGDADIFISVLNQATELKERNINCGKVKETITLSRSKMRPKTPNL